jgi:8-oxo-dGTP diphosphatase
MKRDYVLGFYLSEDDKKVVLIRKAKPTWQAGLLNGVGGKIELLDSLPVNAMVREFKEETGVDTTEDTWYQFLKLEGSFGTMFCFIGWGDVTQCKTMEIEPIEIVNIDDLQTLVTVPNLKWMLPMALSGQIESTIKYIHD